ILISGRTGLQGESARKEHRQDKTIIVHGEILPLNQSPATSHQPPLMTHIYLRPVGFLPR
ncbi:MAG TPA: hypothetical protein VGY77_10895, partial [Gemmataceae bacterium]|nr:hypothetical protein [Gemmataceae bacterium]